MNWIMQYVVEHGINVWIWSAMEDMVQTYVGF